MALEKAKKGPQRKRPQMHNIDTDNYQRYTDYPMELVEFTRFNFADGFIQNIDGPVHLRFGNNQSRS